jgi:hypothetical protein
MIGLSYMRKTKTTKICRCGKFKLKYGTFMDSKGYLSISAGPLRGMRVHELVARAKWGDAAVDAPDRVIHHKNGRKNDPSPDNLILLREADHNAVSAKQYWWFKTHDIKAKQSWDEWFEEQDRMISTFEPIPFENQF